MSSNQDNSRQQCLELLRTLIMNLDLPATAPTSAVRKLIHDLTSTSNAFHLLVEQVATELEGDQCERTVTKLNQLRAHVILNKYCIEILCDALAQKASERRSL